MLMIGGHSAMAQSEPKVQKDNDKLTKKRREVKSDDKAIGKNVTHGHMKKAKGDYNEMRADKKEMKKEQIKDTGNP